MTGKLRTYGCITIARPGMTETGNHNQVRAIVATTSQKRAAELIGISPSQFRWNGAETGDAREIEIATSEPERVFYTSATDFSRDYRRWENQP